VPAGRVRVEDRVHNSRFIATLARATTADEARALVAALRDEFPDATHHCSAFVAGPPGSTASVGSSDDGEPAGTAGRPMLSVLLNCGVGEVAVVMTRYFGGVKLGKGGLVRAYSGAVQHALREARTAERVETRALRIDIPYAHVDAVRRALEQHGATIDDETFEGAVTLCVRVGEDRVDALTQALADATAGAARIQPAE
jgi:uncharacterized YigZ family protein